MSLKGEMSFIDHLEVLRWHIIRAFASIFLFSTVAFFAKEIVFKGIILAPSRADFWTYRMLCQSLGVFCIEKVPFVIQSRTMSGQLTMHLAASFAIGLIFAFPYAFWEIWRFIKPGLYNTEQKAATGATFFVSLLFLLGIGFGYYVVTPISVTFLANYQIDVSIVNEFDIVSYVSTVAMLTLGSGVMFQLPVFAFFLSKIGVLTPSFMRTYRRHAIVIIMIIAAVITPPDVISQIIVSLPLLFLYEISIHISAYVEKKRDKELALR